MSESGQRYTLPGTPEMNIMYMSIISQQKLRKTRDSMIMIKKNNESIIMMKTMHEGILANS